MRKIKSIVALALVFAMAFTFTAGAVNFTDASTIAKDYTDDVNMLVELGVISGYPDGSFGPKKNITRAEFAKMAYTIIYGSDTDGDLFAAQKSSFWDVEGNASVAWAKGYINYCASNKIVSGVGGGKFNPSGNITVAEASKMLLVILGCDPAKEGFTGANWMSNVVAKAMELGVYDGWQGDPAALATRELVAKLMSNTILSSIYTYSAVSGIGSQKDALGQNWNETLGQKTMGLRTVSGIVVANERYAIDTDEEGHTLNNVASIALAANSGDYVGTAIAPRGVDSEESVILYETVTSDGTSYLSTMVIDRAVTDELLGNHVNVFFKADKKESSTSGRIDYTNIKVLGDVVVSTDSVSYIVPASDVEIYPNGESSSTAKIQPYLSLKVDGAEKKILTSSKTVNKVAKDVDAQTNSAAKAEIIANFDYFAYVLTGASMTSDGVYTRNGAAFLADIGLDDKAKGTNTYYRFVSADGGDTFSYMFKINDAPSTIKYGAVTAYSEARGTMKITNIPTLDLEDVVLRDEVAVDDLVVAFRENGKVYVDKVDVITGAVSEFGLDGSVTVGGEKYFAEKNCDLDGAATLSKFFEDNRQALNASTKFYVYNNLILEIEIDEEANLATNFGVIIDSYFEGKESAAYVTLTTADNTTATYKVGKLYTADYQDENSTRNDRARDFDKNNYFGRIIEYKLLPDGTLDLSSQFLKSNKDGTSYYYNGLTVDGAYNANGVYTKVTNDQKKVNATIFDSKLELEEKYFDRSTGYEIDSRYTKATYRPYSNDTVVFLIYGAPKFDPVTAENDTLHKDYAPITARAYKISAFKETISSYIENLYVAGTTSFGGIAEEEVISVKFNRSDINKTVVAAAFTVGEKLGNPGFQETKNIAYVLSATQKYNAKTGGYYATFTIADEKGLRTVDTVENVTNLNATGVLSSNDGVGSLSGTGGRFEKGSFILYKLDADGKICVLDNTGVERDDVKKSFSTGNGLYLVTIVRERGDNISFYEPYTGANATEAIANLTLLNADYHEDDGCKIIGIAEGAEADEYLYTISSEETEVEKNSGNAIIQMEEGQVIRIFSFSDSIKYN